MAKANEAYGHENKAAIIDSIMLTEFEIEKFIEDAGSENLAVFGGKFEGGIQVQQVADELAPCILKILESGELVKSYLEIGSATGGTAFLFNHFFKPGKVVLIDDNTHPKAHIRGYILRDMEYTEIIGHSQTQKTVDVLKSLDIIFDVILIDGDHTYQGVSCDVKLYRSFLRPGGFLILHDSALPELGIMQVIEELKVDDGMEFIGEYVTGKHYRPCGIALFMKVNK